MGVEKKESSLPVISSFHKQSAYTKNSCIIPNQVPPQHLNGICMLFPIKLICNVFLQLAPL